MRVIPSIAVLLLASGHTFAKKFSKAKDAVLLSNVRTLTLQAEKQTSNRRVSAIPQLTCVGGNAKSLYNVDVMRCSNSGSEYDAEDIQWTCQASLPPEFKLGSTEVICEGYDSPDDPYVLKGSCGVEYRLILTEMGEQKYGSRVFDQKPTKYSGFDRHSGSSSSLVNTFWRLLFWGVFLVVVGIILYKIFFPQRRIALPNFGGFGGGGGGGGGGGHDNDPPPPYTPRAPPRSKPNTAPRSAPRSAPSSSQTRSSGPGFWSGAATGGAAGYGAGYYMGRRSQEQERERERQRMPQPGPSGGFFGGGGGPSSFGGGGGGSSSSSSAPTPSSSRYESTGFGGTRRR